MTTMIAGNGAGPLVREWRRRRRLSQLDLALDTGVSTRHLSFVETGRSNPSPELLLALADRLEIPLREQNSLLLAAGYAPRYHHTPLDDPIMAPARAALERLLALHDPYPGVVIDQNWNMVMANEAAGRFMSVLPPSLAGPPVNIFRACLHPDGFAASTLNFPEWAAYLLGQLHRITLLTADPDISALTDEVDQYPNVKELRTRTPATTWPDTASLLVPWQVELDRTKLSLFTTLTCFGTPRDVTLAELAVELFYPADNQTADHLRR